MPVVASSSAAGLRLTEHELEVPLDHGDPGGPSITVFAREVAALDGLDRPLLLFLQGGPGLEAPRPSRSPTSPGWLVRALQEFRVVLLDQRGTGRSSPVGRDLQGLTPQEQADRLAHFRADSIVRDAELLRQAMGAERWSVLGQSFGGFCVLTYLALAPEGLREALITGGLPSIGPGSIDAVYERTWARTIVRCERHFARYPEDRARVRELVARLEREEVLLADGSRLTPERVRSLGGRLGMSDGSEALHALLELPFGSPAFLHDLAPGMGFTRNPLHALLHEACWADGGTTRWAAQRTMPSAYAEQPELLTGEHVLPWAFEQLPALAPLREAAGLLAERAWPRLHDPERLAANEVPVAAAIYAQDMYVPREASEATAAQVRGLRPWLTDELEHNGLRADGERVLGRLLDLVRDRV